LAALQVVFTIFGPVLVLCNKFTSKGFDQLMNQLMALYWHSVDKQPSFASKGKPSYSSIRAWGKDEVG
jgi:hypothetical protein